MAPTKPLKVINASVHNRTTRSQLKSDLVTEHININGKRRSDENEQKPSKRARPALGNITNATINEKDVRKIGVRNNAIVKTEARAALRSIANVNVELGDTKDVKKKVAPAFSNQVVTYKLAAADSNVSQPLRMPKVMTRAAARAKATVQNQENKSKPVNADSNRRVSIRRLSDDFNNSEESLYLSAHEDLSSSKLRLSLNDISKRSSLASNASTDNTTYETIYSQEDKPTESGPPPGVTDFDQLAQCDPFDVSEYAMDIFKYLKEREKCYPITPYLDKQVQMNKWMRTLVVDWMVEVQEAFELNHETLYLAVKIIDVYLGQKVIVKDNLQLLGAAALLIASKFDERTPPLVEDFHYICDNVYSHDQFIKMEIEVFKTINCDLGFPLSYRFVRRYARCGQIPLPILTLARFILEYSLMDYDTITFSDSKMASAALYMALRMVKKPGWNATLEYYSGYNLADFADIVLILNNGLHKKLRDSVKTIRNKYSHKLFHEVAKIPLMSNEQLLQGTEILPLYMKNRTSC